MLSLVFATVLWAAPKPKTTCTTKELARRDCVLRARDYTLRLLEKTIAWTDGTWHTVDPLPLIGDGVVWEKITFGFLNEHPIVQLWMWDKGPEKQTLPVQSLHWFVADAEKRKFTVLASSVVRRRHRKETDPKAPPQYLYDAMEPHGLTAVKGGHLEWKSGRETKTLY